MLPVPLGCPWRNQRGACTRGNEMNQDPIPTVGLEEAVLRICNIPLATMGPNDFLRVREELAGNHLDPLWPTEYYKSAVPPPQDPRWDWGPGSFRSLSCRRHAGFVRGVPKGPWGPPWTRKSGRGHPGDRQRSPRRSQNGSDAPPLLIISVLFGLVFGFQPFLPSFLPYLLTYLLACLLTDLFITYGLTYLP